RGRGRGRPRGKAKAKAKAAAAVRSSKDPGLGSGDQPQPARPPRFQWGKSALRVGEAPGPEAPSSPPKRPAPSAEPPVKRELPEASTCVRVCAKRPAPGADVPVQRRGRQMLRIDAEPPAARAPAVPRAPSGLLGGRNRALSLFDLGAAAGREALIGLVKQGYTVVRNVFSEAECDAAVDKIWGFAEGRCPSLKAADESTWTAENWGAFARGKCLCQLLGAGWVLWEERLLFRRRLVERGIYADRPHHASWDGFTFGRPVSKLWKRSEWDHT
ncbi:unnamed protein product, partial [Symbiodinium sp. CCMP2456]